MKLHGTMTVNNDELYIGGVSCLELSKKYQTPLYVFDEELIRNNSMVCHTCFQRIARSYIHFHMSYGLIPCPQETFG